MLSRRFLIDFDFAAWIFGGVMQRVKHKHGRHGSDGVYGGSLGGEDLEIVHD